MRPRAACDIADRPTPDTSATTAAAARRVGTVAIIDYGLGNLRSVAGAIEHLGYTARISSRVEDLAQAERLILPGVGAFGDGMKHLRERGLIEPLSRLVLEQHKPILGICLGAQLLAKESEEFGHHEGLGWVDASVVRLAPRDPTLKIPHVGWDELQQVHASPLFHHVPQEALFYYVHSFHVRCTNPAVVIGRCDYGMPFVAAYQQDHIFGTQFHPEKSQQHGLQVLRNFIEQGGG